MLFCSYHCRSHQLPQILYTKIRSQNKIEMVTYFAKYISTYLSIMYQIYCTQTPSKVLSQKDFFFFLLVFKNFNLVVYKTHIILSEDCNDNFQKHHVSSLEEQQEKNGCIVVTLFLNHCQWAEQSCLTHYKSIFLGNLLTCRLSTR